MSTAAPPITPTPVAPPTPARQITAEEMLDNDQYKTAELVYGAVREKNVSEESSRIEALIAIIVGGFIRQNRLGRFYSATLGYKCFPDDPVGFRMPDFSFVRTDRVPLIGNDPGYMPIRPDLAVEVISPGDRAGEIRKIRGEYLSIDIPLIWTVYPDTKEVIVSRPGLPDVTLTAADTLDGADVLPGFACMVRELFE